tara:strand:- start:307 stop:558 length:252 start_codon:yes stop_codon:yes gene_type:complete
MSKITKEELKQLQEQEQKKSAIYHDLGVLETQKHSLNHLYTQVMTEQNDSKKELEEKYGKVNIDLKDGSYTVIEEDEEKGENK